MRKKKLIVGILVFMLTLIAFGLLNASNGASLGKLTITKERTANQTVTLAGKPKTNVVTYKHQLNSADNNDNTKNIWKIVKTENGAPIKNPNDPKYLKDLYCLRAGLGFTSPTTTVEGVEVEYNWGIPLSRKNIEQSYQYLVNNVYNQGDSETTLFKEGHSNEFYAVLWILDNMLLEGATDNELKAYLKDTTKGAGYTEDELNRALKPSIADPEINCDMRVRNVLTRADIEVIQQLAIWYFTNSNETAYHKDDQTIWLSIKNEPYESFNTGTTVTSPTGGTITRPEYMTFADAYNVPSSAVAQIGDEGSWGTQKQSHATTLYKNLIREARKAVTQGGGKYTPKRDMTIWLAGGNFLAEQPVIQVEENKGDADIALRKFISEVDGVELTETRAPEVDTSVFNDGEGANKKTTAKYFHPKAPVKVKLGQTVTYRIRLYNEGDIPAHVEQVKDYLPSYLTRVIPEGKEATENYWVSAPEDNEAGYIYQTTENCKIVDAGGKLTVKGEAGKTNVSGMALKDVLIPAVEQVKETGKDRYTISYVDIEIYCEVMDKAKYNEAITNIAQVTKMTNEAGDPLEDRDSDVGEKDKEGNGLGNADIHEGNPDPNAPKGPLPDYKDEDPNHPYEKNESGKPYVPGQEDDDDFDKVIIETPTIDLALRKYISQIGDTPYHREPHPETAGNLQTGNPGTADYIHDKGAIPAHIGDVVTYKIRVYNEGKLDGKVTEITDYIPTDGTLVYTAGGDDPGPGGEGAWWSLQDITKPEGRRKAVVTNPSCKIVDAGGKLTVKGETGKISVAGKTIGDEVTIPAYDKNTNTLSWIEVEVHMMIGTVKSKIKLTNIAEITEEKDENGRLVEEDDEPSPSKPDDVKVPDDTKLPDYKEDEIEDIDPDRPHIPGQEDDDDFEKVIVEVPEIDLSLRKFITKVETTNSKGEKEEKSYLDTREPKVVTDKLDDNRSTTAEYFHYKNPIQVKRGDIVTYKIRLYNEGEISGYVNEVTDYLPNYLEFLEDNEINKKYGWVLSGRQVKTTVTAKDNAKGDEIYSEDDKLLEKYDKETNAGELDHVDLEIVCKVKDEAPGNTIQTNLAQITDAEDVNGNKIPEDIEDRDSEPDGDKDPGKDFDLPTDDKRPTYKDEDPTKPYVKDKEDQNKPYVPGQEDDDDFEKVLVKPDFDLALRKFITEVQNAPINNRYPEVKYENGKISYHHRKDPVEVCTGDTVIYTIRVFNEGQMDGWADEITDDMPEGLEYLPDHEINRQYRWRTLDKDGEETNEQSEIKYVVTDYLSQNQEVQTGRNNKIKAFDPNSAISDSDVFTDGDGGQNPDYRDVKLAFKVTYVAKTKEESARIIKNVAQISDDSDDDIDSEPDRDTPHPDPDDEDDIDFDNVKVKYFDLSLLKWVSQTKVKVKNGDEVITDTGHTAETSKNEAPVKIEIQEKDLKTIQIKYVYTIRITNEGEIEGYADEVKDYIPEGLKFIEDDNKEWRWKIAEEGVVVTDYLNNTLLKPGEYAEVPIVLTWINSSENLGEKVNLAEISKDRNDSDSPDVDSTPDNKVPGEDDIDDAPVVLAVKTGIAKIYVGLTMIILLTFALGIGLIKKYVIEF